MGMSFLYAQYATELSSLISRPSRRMNLDGVQTTPSARCSASIASRIGFMKSSNAQ